MDDELENIRKRKMEELIAKKTGSQVQKMPDHPIEITDANFEEFIRNYPKVVVDCWAPWCGPCRMLAPVIDKLAEDFAGEIVFGKLNVDHNPETSEKFGIMSIPTLLVFRNGKLVDKMVGAMPLEPLKRRIKAAF
ncbi:MAG: thioredoxin [Thermoplasmata archaeon]